MSKLIGIRLEKGSSLLDTPLEKFNQFRLMLEPASVRRDDEVVGVDFPLELNEPWIFTAAAYFPIPPFHGCLVVLLTRLRDS